MMAFGLYMIPGKFCCLTNAICKKAQKNIFKHQPTIFLTLIQQIIANAKAAVAQWLKLQDAS